MDLPADLSALGADAWWPYYDDHGLLLACILSVGGKKYAYRATANGRWIAGLPDGPRPLYRLPDLLIAPPELPVYVVPTEEDADILAKHRYATATAVMGGESGVTKTAWSPVRGRDVLLLYVGESRRFALRCIEMCRAASARRIAAVDVSACLANRSACNTAADALTGNGALCRTAAALGDDRDTAVRTWLLQQLGEACAPSDRNEAYTAEIVVPLLSRAQFPTNALPAVAGAWTDSIVAAAAFDAGYVALPVLASLAAAIGPKVAIRVTGSWSELPILWAALIGSSAAGKSPSMALALKPLCEIYSARYADYSRAMARYNEELAAWEAKKKTERGNKPPKPHLDRLYITDATTEALLGVLSEQHCGVLVHADELAGWVRRLDLYHRAAGADVATWLTLWGGSMESRERKTNMETVVIEKSAVSLVGGITPESARILLGGASLETGMGARFLYVWPPDQKREWALMRSDALAALDTRPMVSLLSSLIAVQPETTRPFTPRNVVFDRPAANEFGKAFDSLGDEVRGGTEEFLPLASKSQAYLARLVLILTMADTVPGKDVPTTATKSHVERAWTILRWCLDEARRVAAVLFAGSASAKDLDAAVRTVMRFGGSISLRDFMRTAPAKFRPRKTAERLFRRMEESGLGIVESGDRGGIVFRLM